ncbi:MAG: serine hydrolase domain-containing protein, partial [Sphingopyxis sp.]|nr:serine hydrolase domain-containing protein [Sphingopyxis sp.]
MIRSLLNCLLFVIGMTVSGMAQAAPEAEAAIAAAVQAEMSAKQVPSIAVALVDRDGLIWSKAWGFADADRRQPVTADTVYRAGSVSKLLTDVAIMRLVETGRIDLDAPVTKYLPSFHPRNPFGGSITLRQLMTHRSGLVREPPRGHYFDTNAKGQADTVLSLNDTALVAKPGAITKYS